MFCIKCGTPLEEQWKACPNCGTKTVRKQENKEKELSVKEPETTEKYEDITSDTVHEFCFEGFRRTNRFSFMYYASEVEITGDKIKTIVHKKKDVETTFSKTDITDIKFPFLPVLRGLDIFLILLFIVLAFFTKGLAIFAALFFAKISMVKHMQIKLKDGRKVAIPIRQPVETVDFLEAIDYSPNVIRNIAAGAVSNKTIVLREWIVSGIMLIIAVVTMGIASEQIQSKQMDTEIEQTDHSAIDDGGESIEENREVEETPDVIVEDVIEETVFVGRMGTYEPVYFDEDNYLPGRIEVFEQNETICVSVGGMDAFYSAGYFGTYECTVIDSKTIYYADEDSDITFLLVWEDNTHMSVASTGGYDFMDGAIMQQILNDYYIYSGEFN